MLGCTTDSYEMEGNLHCTTVQRRMQATELRKEAMFKFRNSDRKCGEVYWNGNNWGAVLLKKNIEVI